MSRDHHYRRRSAVSRGATLLVCLAALHSGARADEVDVPDTLFRYTTGDAVAVSQSPEERIDPFSGNLRIVHRDYSLPQRGDLQLVLQRVYTSKVWGRADAPMVPAAAARANFIELQEHRPLGPGWMMHLGRIKNPAGRGGSDTGCNDDLPMFQDSSGMTETFYCSDGSGSGWDESTQTCSIPQRRSASGSWYVPGTAPGPAVLHADGGLTYEFARGDGYCYGDGPCSEYVAGERQNLILPVSKISDAAGNHIDIEYYPGSNGVMKKITDSYGREITFGIANGKYTYMAAGAARIDYGYTSYRIRGDVFDLLFHDFLSDVSLPGDGSRSWHYDYVSDTSFRSLRLNAGALSKMTYPEGGTISYEYGSWDGAIDFITGAFKDNDDARILHYIHTWFAPVTKRTEGGRLIAPATTTYAYTYDEGERSTPPAPVRPPLRDGTQTTTITRPDGKRDVYTFEGWGEKHDGSTWMVGLLKSVTQGDAASVTDTTWEPVIRFPGIKVYGEDWRGGYCGWRRPVDADVVGARQIRTTIAQDGVVFVTESSLHDAYDQPAVVHERVEGPGNPERVTTRTYFVKDAAPPLFLRGRTASSTRCIGATDCVTDRNGFDPMLGRLIWAEKADAAVRTDFTYHADGNLALVVDPAGSSVTLDGYIGGLPTQIELGGLLQIQQTPSWEGWTMSRTLGTNTTSYARDASGRVTIETPPVGARLIHDLSDPTRVRVTKEGFPSFQETRFDGFGRGVETENSEGVLTKTQYDVLGRTIFQSLPYTGTPVGETMEYDALGRLTRTVHPDNTSIAIGRNGLEVTTTNERASTWRSLHEAFGSPADMRVVRVTEPNAEVTTYRYDVAGNVLEVDEPGLDANRLYFYDSRGYKSAEIDPESGVEWFWSDDAGNLVWQADSFKSTIYFRDMLHRVRTIDRQGTANDVSIDYHPTDGWKISASSPAGGAYQYVHDGIGRVVQQVWSYLGVDYTTTYEYDAAGCLEGIRYPTGRIVSGGCDTLARPNSVDGFVPTATYHPTGNFSSFTYQNGRTTTVTRDDRTRIIDIDVPGVLHMALGHDPTSNVTDITETFPLGVVRTMTYDDLNRLETADGPWGMARFVYDAAGNRRRKSIDGGPATDYVYDAMTGRLTESTGADASLYSWNPLGQLLSGDGTGYSWNELDKIASTSDGTSFAYDADLRPVKRTPIWGDATVNHHDSSGRKIVETRVDGSVVREYVYLGTRLAAILTPDPKAGLVGCWSLDGHVMDATSNANHGVVNGDVDCTVAGVFGLGCQFNGGYVSVPASTSLDVGAQPGASLTLEAWMRPEAGLATEGRPLLEYGSATDLGVHLWQNPLPQLFGNVVPTAPIGDKSFSAPPTPFVPGQWYHVALTYDGLTGIASLWVDGNLAAQRVPEPPYAFETATDFLIGARLYPFDGRFLGRMDEVRVWSRALGPIEIARQASRTESLCSSLGNDGPSTPPIRYVHADHLNSIVATTGSDGYVKARESYGPFGETSGPGCADERYNGRTYEAESGIYDYAARYYHPSSARFISADSYAGDAENPQSHGRYSYVLNNPYKYTDPTGHNADSCQSTIVCLNGCDCRPAIRCTVEGGGSGGGGGFGVTIIVFGPPSAPDLGLGGFGSGNPFEGSYGAPGSDYEPAPETTPTPIPPPPESEPGVIEGFLDLIGDFMDRVSFPGVLLKLPKAQRQYWEYILNEDRNRPREPGPQIWPPTNKQFDDMYEWIMGERPRRLP